MIQMTKVNKYYYKGKNNEVHALRDVDFTLEKGDMIAITGPSGSGKSTLLRLIAGLEKPDSGEILWQGQSMTKMKEKEICALRNRSIGLVMQDYALLSNETVLRNVCLPEIIGNTYNKEIRAEAEEILQQLKMDELRDKKVLELSGGEKQRTAIARSLLMGAELILADEPTGALDHKSTESLMDLLCDLHEQGVTIMIVTHDQYVAARCEKEYQIVDGVLQ